MNITLLCVLCFQGRPNTEHTVIIYNELYALTTMCSSSSYKTSAHVLQFYCLMQFNSILIYGCFNYINYITEH